MSAMQRRKGAAAERAVVTYLRDLDWPDARRYLAGDGRQPGDIDAIPGVCLEVKNHARYDFQGWLRQAVEQAGARTPVVVAKPVGVVDVGEWFAVLRFADLLNLVRSQD